MIHFTELDRLPTYDVKGNLIGLMADLLVDPERQSRREKAERLSKEPPSGSA